MKLTKIIFSPTGGTQKAADIIANELDENPIQMDLTDTTLDFTHASFNENETVIIAMPSFGGRAPELAVNRLSEIRGGNAKAIIVCVYGNRAYEDTLVEMQDAAKKCGFRIIAAVSAVAEHSIMHQYASGRPDSVDKAELIGFAKRIRDKINNGENNEPDIPGNRPYKKAGKVGLIPKTAKECTNCGKCADGCPAGAIDKNDVKKIDSGKCISCMRCVSCCPNKAKKLNSAIVNVAAMAIKKACSIKKNNELFI